MLLQKHLLLLLMLASGKHILSLLPKTFIKSFLGKVLSAAAVFAPWLINWGLSNPLTRLRRELPPEGEPNDSLPLRGRWHAYA